MSALTFAQFHSAHAAARAEGACRVACQLVLSPRATGGARFKIVAWLAIGIMSGVDPVHSVLLDASSLPQPLPGGGASRTLNRQLRRLTSIQ